VRGNVEAIALRKLSVEISVEEKSGSRAVHDR
jgi:hypothetical protein